MVRAAIDIGSNTILLLVAEIGGEGEEITTIREIQRIPRLGSRVDRNKIVADDRMDKAVSVLLEYRGIIGEQYPEVHDTVVTATSAVRDATNRERFVKRVLEETGYEVRVLDGAEEAVWMYAGALGALSDRSIGTSVVIDIGGGSTEIAYGRGETLHDRYSLDMGSVRFTERFFWADPPSAGQVEQCEEEVLKMLSKQDSIRDSSAEAIGIAGTVTSLAVMDRGWSEYQAERVNGLWLSRDNIDELLEQLSGMTAKEIETHWPKLMKGRADLITAGAVILRGILRHFEFTGIRISAGGIRHGALIKTHP